MASSFQCPRCKAYSFENSLHVCPPRWAAVTLGEDEPPSAPFAWNSVDNNEDVYAHTAEDAAETARAQHDIDAAEYPSNRIVGVMRFDTFRKLEELAEEEESPLIDPAVMTWFRVECSYEPTYSSMQLQPKYSRG